MIALQVTHVAIMQQVLWQDIGIAPDGLWP